MQTNEFQQWSKKQETYWNNRIKTRGILLSVAPTTWFEERKEEFKKYGCVGEQIDELVLAIFRTIQANLMEQVMLTVVERWLNGHSNSASDKSNPRIILDVGVGTGEFAVRMVPFTLKKGFQYIGIDFADNSIDITRQRLELLGLTGDLIALNKGLSNKLPLVDNSVWLSVWGKFGQHLTYEGLWEQSIEEIKRTLEPSGYFLVYETMQEYNEEYTNQKKEREPNNQGTKFRSRSEYDEMLHPLKRVETLECKFCEEVFTIAVWQK